MSRRAAIPFTDWLDEIMQWLADDAAALGVETELKSLTAIPVRGASAHHQRSVYERARQRGKSSFGATRDVVQWLKGVTSGELLFGSAGGVVAGPGARLMEKA